MFNCPSCGAKLDLSLVLINDTNDTKTSPLKTCSANFKIDRKSYTLSDTDIFVSIQGIKSIDTIRRYYIEYTDGQGNIKKYPIKQIVRDALETNYPNKFTENYFTAHRARDILTKLGFEVKTQY